MEVDLPSEEKHTASDGSSEAVVTLECRSYEDNCTLSQPVDHEALLLLDPTTGHDQASLAHTTLPVPAQLTVKPSSIPGAALGVFTTTVIGEGVKMGPYVGKRVYMEEVGNFINTAYAWEVRHKGAKPYLIDGQDTAHSNWMRFVNCARDEGEQNVAAYQHRGNIYYRTIRNIDPDSELLVLYGEEYAKELFVSTPSEDAISSNFCCRCCGEMFVEMKSLLIHLKCSPTCAKANPQTFSCGKCQQEFNRLGDFQQHIKEHENVPKALVPEDPVNKPFECEHCGKSFSQKSYLQRHLRIHSGSRPYECSECGKHFTHSSNLHQHIKTHSGDKPFVCDYCKKMFCRSSTLMEHLRTHSGDRPYKCYQCEKTFSQSSNLTQHLKIHSLDKPHKCDHCSKCFRHKGHLKQHLRTHSGERPYKCEHCDRRFSSNSSFHEHTRKHTGDKPYKCDHCEKCFSQSSNLIQHLKTHSGNKPHKCSHCDKNFLLKGHLQQHLRTHSEEKPFKCDQCDKGFRLKSHLQQHLRTHSGEKLYKCQDCEKTFSHNSNLIQHRRTHLKMSHSI